MTTGYTMTTRITRYTMLQENHLQKTAGSNIQSRQAALLDWAERGQGGEGEKEKTLLLIDTKDWLGSWCWNSLDDYTCVLRHKKGVICVFYCNPRCHHTHTHTSGLEMTETLPCHNIHSLHSQKETTIAHCRTSLAESMNEATWRR
jgi:hypothetical protein